MAFETSRLLPFPAAGRLLEWNRATSKFGVELEEQVACYSTAQKRRHRWSVLGTCFTDQVGEMAYTMAETSWFLEHCSPSVGSVPNF